MKGQYLAIESVLTVGMGLTLAIGIITIFDNYQQDITETTMEKDAETVEYRLKSSLYSMRNVDSGSEEIELPEKIGGREYTTVLDEDVRIITPEKEYISNINNLQEYEKEGSVPGGTVTLYKSGDQYILRSN